MKPRLPEKLRKINNLSVIYYYLHGLVVWLVPGAVSYWLWQQPQLATMFKIPLMIALAVIGGFGLFFMALLGHEGFHGSLNRSRHVSMALGIVPSSVVPFFVSTGYNIIHWQHHLYTNTERDPDYVLYQRYKGFLARVAMGPSTVMQNCLRSAFRIFTDWDSVQGTFPFSKRAARVFVVMNLACSVGFLTLYGYLIVTHPVLFVLLVGLPGLFTSVYWAMAPYLEHAGAGMEEGRNTRTFQSRLYNVLLLNYCYHNSHHLYPRVQLHKLKAVHRYLDAKGLLDEGAVVEKSLLQGIRIGMTGNFHMSSE